MGAWAEPSAETEQCKLRADAETLEPNLNDTEVKTNSGKPESEYEGRRVSFTCGVTQISNALPALTLEKNPNLLPSPAQPPTAYQPLLTAPQQQQTLSALEENHWKESTCYLITLCFLEAGIPFCSSATCILFMPSYRGL